MAGIAISSRRTHPVTPDSTQADPSRVFIDASSIFALTRFSPARRCNPLPSTTSSHFPDEVAHFLPGSATKSLSTWYKQDRGDAVTQEELPAQPFRPTPADGLSSPGYHAPSILSRTGSRPNVSAHLHGGFAIGQYITFSHFGHPDVDLHGRAHTRAPAAPPFSK